MGSVVGRCCAVLAVVVLSACSNATQPAAPALDLAGDYVGSFQDSTLGSVQATTTLAQHGDALSGTIAIGTANPSLQEGVSWTLQSTNALSGSGTLTENGAACTFAMSGSYSTTTNAITGSYTPVSGCAGEHGTYTLTQQCTDPVSSDRRRTAGLILPC